MDDTATIPSVEIPELSPVISDDILAVPADVFKSLVEHVNRIAEIVNTQSVELRQTNAELTTCKDHISNIARILEDIYDA